MPLPITGLNLLVGALFASHFFGFGLFLPFFPLVLQERGLSVQDIGLVLGLSTIVRIAANPVMTGISDRSGRRRRSILIYSICAGGFLAAFLVTGGFWTALICVSGLMIFWSPIVPLSDAYALDVARNTGADYARMRLWGSVGFIVATVSGGLLAGEQTGSAVTLAILAGVLSTGVVAICLPGQHVPGLTTNQSEAGTRPLLFFMPWFWALLIAGGLLQATHAAFYGFGTLFWREAGISDFEIGLLWAVGVLAEVVLFTFAGSLALKYGPLLFLLAAAVAGLVRWALFPLVDTFFAAAALQTLHGLSFGAAHLGIIGYLARVVPPKWAATGQGLFSASIGIQTAAGLGLSGLLFERAPAYPFWVMAGFAALSLVMLLALRPLLNARLRENSATGPR
ncbi:PPP family 3-phenylpropionic acid transporter [Roseibium hamelinense]|uniref:PPP family 3-phenylpropionic acid transporter n=1 Tax=Roseibium hamelinense TaxID=150831 RepID=A0A562TBH1_9HYPH|nr:MFS transporter [Roseibium hamelinense]MTI45298.1 MFS transporter [Roseibium hamelinense]TWI90336.1 PPP family 3-phenylpropionic acid transporter [Roseibium hamelinense]